MSRKDECIKWIRDFFNKNGKDCKAVIGLSGGKDSSIVATLCVEALGADRVIGVSLPNTIKDESPLVQELVDYLEIPCIRIEIKSIISLIEAKVSIGLYDYGEVKLSNQTRVNLPARIRMSILYAISQSVNGRVSNNCNYSENIIGYATRWGDSVGDFSPLGNLTVTEVKQLGYDLGMPKKFIEEPPADGLCGKTDEDNLGFTYADLDNYILDKDVPAESRKMDELIKKNKFKLEPIPTFLW